MPQMVRLLLGLPWLPYRLLPEFVHAAESVQVALPEPAQEVGREKEQRGQRGTCFVDVGENNHS